MKKNIIIAICLIAFTISSKAQSIICPPINAFEGEWRYINGQDTIKVYLRAKDFTILNMGNPTTIGTLWGWHEYKKGSTIVESNYANRFITLPSNSSTYIAANFSISLQIPQCDTTRHRIVGDIADLSQCRESKIVTIDYNTNHTQLVWKQRHSSGYGFLNGCKGMTLPSSFVLTKQ